MRYKDFQGISISRLGMGNMRLPTQGDDPSAPIDYERAQQIIDYGMAHGVNYYDTAYPYHGGESERFLGQAVKKYPRDSFYLATKYILSASPDYKAVFEEQLQKLQTDYIDFYLIHCINDRNWQTYLDCGCVEYFLEQKKAGRIRYFGFSSHASPENMAKFADHHQWDFAQIQMNYFDWMYKTTAREYKILEERNIPVVVMEPVRGGRLAALSGEAEAILRSAHPEWSTASWALRWAKSHPQVQLVLSGMSTLEQMEENVATFSDGVPFTPEDEEVLMRACEVFKKEVSVPCTACRYCDGCPVGIDIPTVLQLYNSSKVDGQWGLKERLERLEGGKPADCVSCGACTGHCPQSIDVPTAMAELAAVQKG